MMVDVNHRIEKLIEVVPDALRSQRPSPLPRFGEKAVLLEGAHPDIAANTEVIIDACLSQP